MSGEGTENVAGGGNRMRILAFCCNWCSYAGADLAGVSRLQYPTDVRVIRVMCSGRIEPPLMVRPFELGADGVLVMGCHPGDCHYIGGNYQAEKNHKKASELLGMLGVGSERLRLEWVSAAEGPKFADVMRNFVENIRKMGPLGKTPAEGEGR